VNDFSLFEGDLLNRFFARLGLRSRGFWPLAGRFAFLICLTCLPTAYLAYSEGFVWGMPDALNFFGDVAAFGQAFIGYPLFIFAESVIGGKTRSAAKHFLNSGVILPESLPELRKLNQRVSELRKWWLPETACLVLGFIFSFLWLWEETHNAYNTWHALGAPGVQKPTLAGWWVCLIGIPVFNFWWLRWVWKVNLWCWYLYKVSRLRLRLIASHPDMTGGLGFLTEAQSSFALIIFAFGLGIIAPLVGYKLRVEQADLYSYAVAGPLLGFILGAPTFFTTPLLMFTKQLSRTKKRAVSAYQDRATEAAIFFEQNWLHVCHQGHECEELMGQHLQGMKNLNIAFDHIKKMRVVPFDTKSFTQLFGSTLGSLVPLLLEHAGVPKPVLEILDLLKPLFGH